MNEMKTGERTVGARERGRSRFGSVISEMPIIYPNGDVKMIVKYVSG